MLNVTIVIDDSESDRYLARRTIEKAGITKRILEFPDAVDGLELVCDREAFEKECGPWPPRAVVLLDINMPRMGGFEFLEALNGRIEAGEIRKTSIAVVMYTTSSDQSDVDRALSHGVVMDYMIKPITIQSAARIARVAEALDEETQAAPSLDL